MDIIFDLDGTLADCSHRIHHIRENPKNWADFNAAAHKDSLIEEIAEVVKCLVLGGNRILICTGRENTNGLRFDTEQWLDDNGIEYDALYMRPIRDYRDDPIVKAALYQQMLEDGWHPRLVFEDRARVVKMWRELGLLCAQVADGNF